MRLLYIPGILHLNNGLLLLRTRGVSAGTNRKVLLVDDLDFTAHSSGIPLLGNLPLDWGFQQRLGKNLGT